MLILGGDGLKRIRDNSSSFKTVMLVWKGEGVERKWRRFHFVKTVVMLVWKKFKKNYRHLKILENMKNVLGYGNDPTAVVRKGVSIIQGMICYFKGNYFIFLL